MPSHRFTKMPSTTSASPTIMPFAFLASGNMNTGSSFVNHPEPFK